jgi:hypothetical protein
MPKKRQEVKLPVLRSDAAGIDIAAEEIFVAVPVDRDSEPVRWLRRLEGNLASRPKRRKTSKLIDINWHIRPRKGR